jgi:hypothetical protein
VLSVVVVVVPEVELVSSSTSHAVTSRAATSMPR